MVSQSQVDRLTRELEGLRGEVVRHLPAMDQRVNRLLREARELQTQSVGTTFEPALRSVTNLLTCVQRGVASQRQLQRLAS